MPRERCDSLFFTAATVASTGAGLLYGAMLSCKAGGASLTVYNNGSTGNAALSARKLVLMTSDATGTVSILMPMAVQMATGIFCSMSSGACGTVFFSRRD